MNYAKMIEILQAVQELRETEANESEFVCDMVNSEVTPRDIDWEEKKAITDDIAALINRRFSVNDYLRQINSDEEPEDFRTAMIAGLIAKYTEAQNAAV